MDAFISADKSRIEESVAVCRQTLLTINSLYGFSPEFEKLKSKVRSVCDRNKNPMAATARYRLLCEIQAIELFLMSYYYRRKALGITFQALGEERPMKQEAHEFKLRQFGEYFGDEPKPWKEMNWQEYRDKLTDLRLYVSNWLV